MFDQMPHLAVGAIAVARHISPSQQSRGSAPFFSAALAHRAGPLSLVPGGSCRSPVPSVSLRNQNGGRGSLGTPGGTSQGSPHRTTRPAST